MSEFMDDDFWLRLADKLMAYGTGLYNLKRIKRLSAKAIKAHFYGLDPLLRRVLIQRYHKKKTLAAIGRELNMTPQGVRSHELKAYDTILKSALRTPRTLPVHCVSFKNETPSTNTTDGDKSVLRKMPLIDDPCCDRRRIRNVLTELSPRIISQLETGGYRTMKQLCRATPNNLKNIYGIGNVALRNIQQAVNLYHEHNAQFFRREKVIVPDPPRKQLYTPISKRLPPKK